MRESEHAAVTFEIRQTWTEDGKPVRIITGRESGRSRRPAGIADPGD
jgi:hypothetical protein